MSKNDAGRTSRISSRNIRKGQWYKMHFFNYYDERVEVEAKVLEVSSSAAYVRWSTVNGWSDNLISSTVWDAYAWEAMTPEEIMIILLES